MTDPTKTLGERIEKIEDEADTVRIALTKVESRLGMLIEEILPRIERLLWVTVSMSIAATAAVASEWLGGPSAGDAAQAVIRWIA